VTVVAHERAAADVRPCQLYVDHGSAVPSFTEGHHRHPVYLQNRVYGRILDPQLLWLCSTCHDNVHGWLYWLLGERKKPSVLPPPRARQEAQAAYDWYLAAVSAAQVPVSPAGPG
jgi:hypothetical protein